MLLSLDIYILHYHNKYLVHLQFPFLHKLPASPFLKEGARYLLEEKSKFHFLFFSFFNSLTFDCIYILQEYILSLF